jgi:ABC-type transport system involved in cytochrome c biogenesis permease subunit
MPSPSKITVFCFLASYAVALGFEIVQVLWPRRVQRVLALGFAAAGLLAHSLFLALQPVALSSRSWSMVFLAWILAIFYLYGSLHHRRIAWGIFVLPVVLGLSVLAWVFRRRESGAPGFEWTDLLAVRGEQFWVIAHLVLLLLAAVGVCVAFVASVMYLVQARRLRKKALPGKGFRLLSLERLEEMNRHAVTWAFPLLTAGVMIGAALLLNRGELPHDWTDPKILGALGLWAVFALLLYLRFSAHVRGRRVALVTICAFALLVFTLAASHPVVRGGGR